VGEGRHQPVSEGDDLVDPPGREGADAGIVEGDGLDEGHLGGHLAHAVPEGPVAGGTDALVTEAAGEEEFARQGERDRLDVGAALVEPQGEIVGSHHPLPRHRPRRRLLEDLAVGEAGTGIELPVDRLGLHPVEAPVELDEVLLVVARGEHQKERQRDEPPHRSASSSGSRPKALTERAPFARRMSSARRKSKRGSVESTARKKRSEVARTNCGTSATGVQRRGSVGEPRKEITAPKAAKRTVPSKGGGMKAGTEPRGRPPTFSA